MKNIVAAALSLATLFLSVLPTCAADPPTDADIPGVVTLADVRVVLPAEGNLPAHPLFVKEAQANNKHYLFPAFELLSATIRYEMPDGSETDPTPLLRPDGVANVLSAETDGVSAGYVTVRLRDLLLSDRRDALLTAYTTVPGQSADFSLARTRAEWSAQLEIRDPATGQYLPIGEPFPFQRTPAQPEPTAQFTLPVGTRSRVLALLQRSDASENLLLRILSRYDARGVSNATDISVNFLSSGLTRLVQQLTSQPGALQPSLLIPLGGGVNSRSQFEQLVNQGVEVIWLQSADPTTPAAPPEIVAAAKEFLTASFANVEKSLQWSQVDQNRTVSFLLSNGIRMTAPVNKVTEVRDYFKTDAERKTKDLLENDWRRHKVVDVQTAGSVDVLDILGGSASLAGHYDDLDEGHKKELRERFQSDMNEVDKFVRGELTSVVAMDVQQMQEAVTGQALRQKFTGQTFTYVVRDLQLDSSLKYLPTAPPLVSPLFRRGITTLIEAAQNHFPEGFAPPILPGVANTGLVNPAESPRLCEYLAATATTRPAIEEAYNRLKARLDGATPDQWTRFENSTKTEFSIRPDQNGPRLRVHWESNPSVGRYFLWLDVRAARGV